MASRAARALIAAIALGALAPAHADSAFSGRNGVLVFQNSEDCSPANVPSPAPPVVLEGFPCAGLWSMRVDGSAMRALIPTEGNFFTPAFAPDGRRLIVWDGGLTVLDLSGRQRAHIPDRRFSLEDPAWLPTGDRFAWVKRRDVCPGPNNERRIEVSSVGGRVAKSIRQRTRYAAAPAFSPDGRLVAYDGFNRLHFRVFNYPDFQDCFVAPRGEGLWVQRPGQPSSARRLAPLSLGQEDRINAARPDFSPDGRSIAFISRARVMVIGVDGRHLRELRGSRDATGVAWSPNGRLITWSFARPSPPRVLKSTGLMVELARGGHPRTIARWNVPADFERCGGCGIGGLTWQPVGGRR